MESQGHDTAGNSLAGIGSCKGSVNNPVATQVRSSKVHPISLLFCSVKCPGENICIFEAYISESVVLAEGVSHLRIIAQPCLSALFKQSVKNSAATASQIRTAETLIQDHQQPWRFTCLLSTITISQSSPPQKS